MDGRHQSSAKRFELTKRQKQVLRLMAEGRTNYEIAVALGISLEGAKYHVSEVLAKYEVSSREEAVARWSREQALSRRLKRRLVPSSWPLPLRWAGGMAAAGAVVSSILALTPSGSTGQGASEGPTPVTPTPVPLGAVVATIPVGVAPASIAAGEGAVWVAINGAGEVARIDPSTNQVTTTIPLGYRFFHVAAGLGGVWAASADPAEVTRIDPATNERVAVIPLYPDEPGRTGGGRVAVGPDSVWVLDRDGRTVLRIDPGTNAVSATIPIDSETALSALTVDRDRVWVLTLDGELIRIDARTNSLIRDVHRFDERPIAIAASPDGFWISTQAGHYVGRLHPVSQTVNRIADSWLPGPIVLTGDSAWVIVGRGNGGVMRVPINSGPGTEGRVIDVGREPFAIAAGEGGIWIADLSGTAVWRIDPTIDGPESTHDFEATPTVIPPPS